MQFETANGVLIARNGGEMLRIEPVGQKFSSCSCNHASRIIKPRLGTY